MDVKSKTYLVTLAIIFVLYLTISIANIVSIVIFLTTPRQKEKADLRQAEGGLIPSNFIMTPHCVKEEVQEEKERTGKTVKKILQSKYVKQIPKNCRYN